MLAKRSSDATKKLSLHGQTSSKSVIDNTIVHQAFRRNSRRISVDAAVLAFSSPRRRTVHTAGHSGVSDRYSIDSPPLSVVYTSKAVRAYRQRRALHHKEREKKKKDNKHSESNEGCKQTPLERFRRAVRLVIILRGAFKNIVIYASQKGRHEQITSETTLSLRANTAKGTYDDLLFDPEVFKCQFKDSFPLSAKHAADKDPGNRTNEEVQLLVRLMNQLKGFRRYSPDVQTSLCRVLKYDQFGRRRVIIRKGHIAQRLYFIFSGSVCVTDDEDEDSAFSNAEDEKACLKRGDYFGELAFLKKLKRAATIVCLEQTEFLSVSKEDFFATGIDKCFTEDLEKRILFLSNHPLFVTWPRTSLVHIAEVSRVHAYHSDDVIVKNSTNSYWIYFITKGLANVLRLIDLQRCSAYQKHLSKTNAEAESSMGCYPSKHRSSALDTLTLNTFPIIEEDEEEDDSHQTVVKSCHSDINVPGRRTTMLRDSIRSKSAYARSTSSNLNSCQWSQNYVPSKTDVGVGVYMVLDRITAGQLFGGWSVIQQEDEKDRKRPVLKDRTFILLSGGCEVIKMPKKEFCRDADSETIEQLRRLATNYPSDNKLCQAYLRQSHWRSYREELVDDIIERRQAIKQGPRRTLSKPTPAMSPLWSLDARHSSFSAWEPFRGTSSGSSRVFCPDIKIVEKRRPRTTPKPHQSRATPVSRCSQRAGSSSKYPLNPNPLVGEKVVVAKGSHRSLVLTHGGMRCNDYIEKIVTGLT